MAERRGLILLVNVALVASLLVILFWESDEDAIRARLDSLGRVISRQGDEPIIAIAGRVLELEGLFTEDVHVDVGNPVREVDSRARLVEFFKAAWPRMGKSDLAFKEVRVNIAPDSKEATATAIAHAVWSTLGGEVRHDEREVVFELVLQDGDWLISGIENPELNANQ